MTRLDVDFTFIPLLINQHITSHTQESSPISTAHKWIVLHINQIEHKNQYETREERWKMVTEEDIHRYHMSERVYGVPLPPYASLSDVAQSSKGRKREIGMSSAFPHARS